MLDGCDCVPPEFAIKATLFHVRSGDLLIALTGATTGKVGLIPKSDEHILVNQRVGKFFLGDKPLDRVPFLFASLLYPPIAKQLQPAGEHGSAQDNLSPDYVRAIPLILPPAPLVSVFNARYKAHISQIIGNCAEIRKLNIVVETLLQAISSQI